MLTWLLQHENAKWHCLLYIIVLPHGILFPVLLILEMFSNLWLKTVGCFQTQLSNCLFFCLPISLSSQRARSTGVWVVTSLSSRPPPLSGCSSFALPWMQNQQTLVGLVGLVGLIGYQVGVGKWLLKLYMQQFWSGIVSKNHTNYPWNDWNVQVISPHRVLLPQPVCLSNILPYFTIVGNAMQGRVPLPSSHRENNKQT